LITLSRATAKRFVSLLSKTFNLPRNLLKRQAVEFLVDENGLAIESATATHAVRYRDPSYRGLPQNWEAPLEAIQALAISGAPIGGFSLQGEAEVRLHLVEKTIRRDEGFSAPDLVLESPSSPEVGYLLPVNARQALIAAFETTDQRVPGRYALNCIQLQGSKASLAATDGRQLLIQSGLHWPFEEDLLLANYRKLFACGDFPEGPMEVCKTERQLVFRAGHWEFFLPIEESQRYPQVDDVLPAPEEAVANLEFTAGDAKYLREVLPHLPFDALDHERPVTIELNGKIGVRARSMKTPAGVEVILRNSQGSGADLMCAMQRGYMQRALDLGLRRFQFFHKGCAPVVVRQGDTTYCWATYHQDTVVKGTPETELRESPLEVKPIQSTLTRLREPKSHAITDESGASAAQVASRRRRQRQLRTGSRTVPRPSVWRWSDAAKAS
jgi:hypothetical protein